MEIFWNTELVIGNWYLGLEASIFFIAQIFKLLSPIPDSKLLLTLAILRQKPGRLHRPVLVQYNL